MRFAPRHSDSRTFFFLQPKPLNPVPSNPMPGPLPACFSRCIVAFPHDPRRIQRPPPTKHSSRSCTRKAITSPRAGKKLMKRFFYTR